LATDRRDLGKWKFKKEVVRNGIYFQIFFGPISRSPRHICLQTYTTNSYVAIDKYPSTAKSFVSGNKKVELFLKSIPAPLFSFKDSIRSFLSKDSIQQTITEGEMALAFNALNTTSTCFCYN
jgi:hypothetical protein